MGRLRVCGGGGGWEVCLLVFLQPAHAACDGGAPHRPAPPACHTPATRIPHSRARVPQVVAGLVARYRSIPPLLVKLEELVAGTSTGKAPRLAG